LEEVGIPGGNKKRESETLFNSERKIITLSLLEEKYLKLNSGLSLLMPSCG
jgi:hypothetical protein